jgi:hypothetical protein
VNEVKDIYNTFFIFPYLGLKNKVYRKTFTSLTLLISSYIYLFAHALTAQTPRHRRQIMRTGKECQE